MSLESEVDFAFNLLSLLDATNKSVIFSPASILNGLAMVFAGAKGKTAEEIQQLIGKDKNTKEILQFYSDSIKGYTNNQEKATKEKVNATFANRIFISQSNKLLPEFSEIINEYFEGGLEQVNFKDKTETAKLMNDFVNNKTNGQIKEIASADEINPQTSVVLINALHFSAPWENPFPKPWKSSFHSEPPREIDMLGRTLTCAQEWNIAESIEWDTLGIPYKNYEAWMYIVLPKAKDGLANVIKKMNYEMLQKCTTRNKNDYLDVEIPVFEVSNNYLLENFFPNLGVKQIFNDCCDLTGMTQEKGKIEKVIHKAVIKVDEYGTEASAATFHGKTPCCKMDKFYANHPFLYFITRNQSSDAQMTPLDLLFVGTLC